MVPEIGVGNADFTAARMEGRLFEVSAAVLGRETALWVLA
jgi:hypothetical protein